MPRRIRLFLASLIFIAALLVGWAGTAQASATLSHTRTLQILRAEGITWTSTGNCSDRYNPNCTSFAGIRRTTIDGLITLKKASGCPINVTGGTETGHGSGGKYTHWDGWKIDISRHPCPDGYIKRNFKYTGYISGWGHQYRAPSGNVYTDEGDHWDILYYSCGGCDEPGPAPSPSPSPSISPSASPSASPSVSPTAPPSPSPSAATYQPPQTSPASSTPPASPAAPIETAPATPQSSAAPQVDLVNHSPTSGPVP